ncbi:hypothetical protein BBP40_002003 [Aspergillus hancockii]|nr:hypothetical protein BBP40_002003 [Aspergillus hancockii]
MSALSFSCALVTGGGGGLGKAIAAYLLSKGKKVIVAGQVLKDEPSDFLAKAEQEIDINIRGPMHLTLGPLEHLKGKPNSATIMNVSSILAFVPFSVINPVYNGTKAWLHFWSINLRSQLERGGYERIKVIEIAPPSVGTDLHRDREDPDDNKKDKNPNALSVEFMEFVLVALETGDSMIAPGMCKDIVDKWYAESGSLYETMSGRRRLRSRGFFK